jgi:Zn-dependent M28 family amino/carboxypeptidase
MKRDVNFLASDECEGRAPGSLGIDRAGVYIAGQLREAGLKPAGVNKTWFQPFTMGKNNLMVRNVVGVLEGAGPLADETVVIGAHYDHLGIGKGGKGIYRGADDNASGTAGMIELARRFAAMKDRQGRRIVFMAFSAEESGLLGSKHYCTKEPLFPLDKTVAMINLDMVGRLRFDKDNKGGKILIDGVGTAKNFETLLDKLCAEAGFEVHKNFGGVGGSDHTSFFRAKVPVLYIKTGRHPELHTIKDTVDLINFPGMKRMVDLIERVAQQIASDPNRPEFVNVATPPTKLFP